ncbi:Ig-like domain-containing protein [Enterococcus plantarum]|uniref:SdrD B-like domain-containing protein n=1 Tax=Enterococcus plantarum TaxID=1077675 RepID=UPI001A9016F6|nr:SdrD B-like domain-containing protein [Enterococcus plantarum]MBO0467416.1 Ig-like domain-containing protein [Enterococcus plantarum]
MKKIKMKHMFLALMIIVSFLTSGVSVMAKGSNSKAEGTASISAILFEDVNVNGQQETDEPGMEGITVRLLNESGTEITKTITNAQGKYTFDKLVSDVYQLKVDYPEGYIKVTNGSVNFSSSGLSFPFELDEGEMFTDAWIGFQSTDPTITGTVFNDENKSGDKDAAEKGVAGIELGLYVAGSTNPIQTVKTDANGKYSFVKIPPGKTYEIKPISLPSQYEIIKNSNFDENGKSIQFALETLDKKYNVDLALYETIPVTGINVEPKELIQYVGDTGKLTVTITPENATYKEVSYVSGDPTVMTVDKDGNWEAKKVGVTVIKVKTENGLTFEVNVTVKEREGVGATFYDYPRYLGYFIQKGTGTAKNFDDDYNNVEPYKGLGTDYYKVKKVGYVTLKDTGLYTFSIEVDDNGAVYLNDEKIIDRDNITGGTLKNFRYFKAGQRIKITTEHFNKEAPVSYFHLRWQTPSNPYSPKAIPDSEITME